MLDLAVEVGVLLIASEDADLTRMSPPTGVPGARVGRWSVYSAAVSSLSRRDLDALVEEATVDCYNDDEQLTGLFTTMEDNLALPFTTQVLGVEVTVRRLDLRGDRIVAICHRGRERQAIAILDLKLPEPPPDGAQWIQAYRHWSG